VLSASAPAQFLCSCSVPLFLLSFSNLAQILCSSSVLLFLFRPLLALRSSVSSRFSVPDQFLSSCSLLCSSSYSDFLFLHICSDPAQFLCSCSSPLLQYFLFCFNSSASAQFLCSCSVQVFLLSFLFLISFSVPVLGLSSCSVPLFLIISSAPGCSVLAQIPPLLLSSTVPTQFPCSQLLCSHKVALFLVSSRFPLRLRSSLTLVPEFKFLFRRMTASWITPSEVVPKPNPTFRPRYAPKMHQKCTKKHQICPLVGIGRRKMI
jgi:hypothetical protein